AAAVRAGGGRAGRISAGGRKTALGRLAGRNTDRGGRVRCQPQSSDRGAASEGASMKPLAIMRWNSIAVAVATFAAIVLLCSVAAYWFWRWMAPEPAASVLPLMRDDWARTIADARFFGAAPAPLAEASPATQ